MRDEGLVLDLYLFSLKIRMQATCPCNFRVALRQGTLTKT